MNTATETPCRQFKGVWIPAAIWTNKNLTWLEKCILAEIDSLSTPEKPCYASNEYLGEMFNLSERSMHNALTDLRKKGWVKTIAFDGRKRGLICSNPDSKVQAECTESVQSPCTTSDTLETPTIITRDTSLDTPPISPQCGGNFQSDTRSTTCSTTNGGGELSNRPTLQQSISYFSKNGSDYTTMEIKNAWHSLEATVQNNRWFIFGKQVGDWRSALESILSSKRIKLNSQPKPKPYRVY